MHKGLAELSGDSIQSVKLLDQLQRDGIVEHRSLQKRQQGPILVCVHVEAIPARSQGCYDEQNAIETR